MKFTTLELIVRALTFNQHEITLDKKIADKARVAITRMIKV